MKIVAGTHTPAELQTNDGEIIAAGTYTHCGKILDNIAGDFGTGETSELRDENKRLKQQVEALEQLRPHWAKGYTDDSAAAQSAANALSQIWTALRVNDQTECMAKLRALLHNSEQLEHMASENLGEHARMVEIPENVYFNKETGNFYDFLGNGTGQKFYEKWAQYQDDFPRWIHSEEGAEFRADRAQNGGPKRMVERRPNLGGTSPHAGPSNSCDARPWSEPKSLDLGEEDFMTPMDKAIRG